MKTSAQALEVSGPAGSEPSFPSSPSTLERLRSASERLRESGTRLREIVARFSRPNSLASLAKLLTPPMTFDER